MSTTTHPEATCREVALRSFEEHRKLHACYQRVRDTVEQATAARENLLSALRDLRTATLEHIEFEEGDGFMRCVVEQRPTLSRKVDKLRAEHGTQRMALDDLVESLEHAKSRHTGETEVCRAALSLLDDFSNHESHENNLVLEAFFYDVSAKD
jgi:hemerythrin-like domain-containing protein